MHLSCTLNATQTGFVFFYLLVRLFKALRCRRILQFVDLVQVARSEKMPLTAALLVEYWHNTIPINIQDFMRLDSRWFWNRQFLFLLNHTDLPLRLLQIIKCIKTSRVEHDSCWNLRLQTPAYSRIQCEATDR